MPRKKVKKKPVKKKKEIKKKESKEKVKVEGKKEEGKKEEVKIEKKEEKPEEKEQVEPEEIVTTEGKEEGELVKKITKKVGTEEKEVLLKWTPRTNLGKDVLSGKITDINKILDEGIRIKEHEIIDYLIPNMESELIFIGGRPGKGGGIERTPLRISAKMHKSGRRYTSTAFAVVGNKDGIIGIGKGRAKDSRGAINKATKQAKLNLIKVPRGCGSWECGCDGNHSIPFRTYGKSGSVAVTLMPAPRGIGLVVDDETKKVMILAGIKDIWGKTLGNTGARISLVTAVFDALKNLHGYKKS